MKTISISAKKRNELGKKSTRELRKSGNVPCVMYGGEQVVHFYAAENDFIPLVHTPDVYLIGIDLEGEKHHAIMQDVQYHPVTDSIMHIDFVEVFEDRPVVVNLPVKLIGSSIGIKNGGKPRQRRRVLKVRGLLRDLPEYLEIDITNVNIGDVVKIGDLAYDNLDILDPFRSMIFSVVSSRVAMKGMEIVEPEEAAGEAEAEAAEAEEAEESGEKE
ncbi:MAG: 50S ribosomal protein L25 [Bacteroidales bacterium]|nr:50S ribosomal protein L25 [Bacteroidales bacterium]